MQSLDDQRVRERQHQRGIAMRTRRDPFGVEERGRIVAHRADVAELDARGLGLLEPAARRMLADTAGSDLSVARRNAAEHHDQVRVIDDALPTGAGTVHRMQAAENVLHEHGACRVAVSVARAGESADAAEETLQLRSRMMETAGAGPSVGAGVDGVVAAIANHALEFIGDQIERAIPRHGDVAIRSATIASAAGTVLEPSCADCGLRDAAGMVESVGNRVK